MVTMGLGRMNSLMAIFVRGDGDRQLLRSKEERDGVTVLCQCVDVLISVAGHDIV